MGDVYFWVALVTVLGMLVVLAFDLAATEIVITGALFLLLLTGIITPAEAFRGFSNEGMLSVAFLFVVAMALEATGVLSSITQLVFGKEKGSVPAKLARFMVPVAGMSAFINNTPLVAMLVSPVRSWCRRNGFPSSKFLIPLSYATILGGCCTLIGTSTNLVVHGLLVDRGLKGFGFWELGSVGVPVAIAGILAFVLFLHRLLPGKKESKDELGENVREFVVEVKVSGESPAVGKTVEGAGFRHLKGLFLFQIERGGTALAPVEPGETIHMNDRLFFVGLPSTIVELSKRKGLDIVKDEHFDLKNYDSGELKTYEVVISASSPLAGKTVKDSNFRAQYDAVILAIHRGGERIDRKIGEIKFRVGDTLLILANKRFHGKWYHSREFSLVSTTEEVPSKKKSQSRIAIAIALLMILSVTLEILPMVVASGVAAVLLVIMRCVTTQEVFASVDWKVLLAIASSFGVATALENAGVAQYVAAQIVTAASPFGILILLAAVYGTTLVITEIITNNAAAAMLLPIAISVASQLKLDYMPFAYAVTVAASAAFATPMGYQTHMMVMGPGRYRFKHFIKVGVPLDIIAGVVAVLSIWVVFF